MDGPKDLKFEMTARAVGLESAQRGVESGLDSVGDDWEGLREGTRLGVEKVLRYRGDAGRKELEEKAREWTDRIMAQERAEGGWRRQKSSLALKERSEVAR